MTTQTTKTDEQKAADKPAKATKSAKSAKAPTVELPSGKGTQKEGRNPSNPPALERGAGQDDDPGIADGKDDTLRRQRDKARWSYDGSEKAPTADLLREQQELDRNARKG